jgi:hypothetical protein
MKKEEKGFKKVVSFQGELVQDELHMAKKGMMW